MEPEQEPGRRGGEEEVRKLGGRPPRRTQQKLPAGWGLSPGMRRVAQARGNPHFLQEFLPVLEFWGCAGWPVSSLASKGVCSRIGGWSKWRLYQRADSSPS